MNRTDLSKTIALNIKKYRQKKGWSQNKLAIEAGVRQSVIGRLESQGHQNYKLETLVKLATVLGIKVEQLLKAQK